jgi:hypothetical protein
MPRCKRCPIIVECNRDPIIVNAPGPKGPVKTRVCPLCILLTRMNPTAKE